MNKQERLAADNVRDYIAFYSPRDPNGMGSNFSAHGLFLYHPFTGGVVWYKTGEHRYQAMKAANQSEHDYVSAAPTPGQAKARGREITLRDGWGDRYGDLCYYVMLETVNAKIRCNADVLTWLKGTGSKMLYEDSPTDDIWGWRYREDYRGRNLLGRCLMEARRTIYGIE